VIVDSALAHVCIERAKITSMGISLGKERGQQGRTTTNLTERDVSLSRRCCGLAEVYQASLEYKIYIIY
jgi:hypothetical protein